MQMQLPAGHHNLIVRQGNCTALIPAQVFSGTTTDVSATLRSGGLGVIDAYDDSVAGLIPDIPLRVSLVSKAGAMIQPRIKTTQEYDFEFVRPGRYYLDFRLTDGTLCQMPVNFHALGLHLSISVTLADLDRCFKAASPSGL
jgi:hypothetical protein